MRNNVAKYSDLHIIVDFGAGHNGCRDNASSFLKPESQTSWPN